MYLKALEIQGFKSFPDKTVLSFGEDMTAIVGPNGSGKSNISDAIRWVMGEQSSKALRGGKMEDVIFGGTAVRRQQGFAEVSLVLDNTDHIFPMEESEVMVTRRYYRSGESEYYINRRSVRLKDVNELFMDTGLGREGYSIIGQGRIDEILSVKSADRREVFEEAAGISRFRHRKEEAERKLERTQENLVRITDKIDELELQVEPLRAQSEKARKFLVLRDELRGLEISLWLEQLEKIRAGAIKTLSDYENAVRQKEEAQGAVEALYAAAEEHAAQMRDKDVEAEGVRFQMMQREADANGLENAVAVLRANIQNNLENRDRIRRELEQQEGPTPSAPKLPSGRSAWRRWWASWTPWRRSCPQNRGRPRRPPAPQAPWPESWRSCAGRRRWKTPPPPRPGLCSPPWPPRPKSCWTGMRRCIRSCPPVRSGCASFRRAGTRPKRSWPRPGRTGIPSRMCSTATACGWSPAGKKPRRPRSAMSSSRWRRTPSTPVSTCSPRWRSSTRATPRR